MDAGMTVYNAGISGATVYELSEIVVIYCTFWKSLLHGLPIKIVHYKLPRFCFLNDTLNMALITMITFAKSL